MKCIRLSYSVEKMEQEFKERASAVPNEVVERVFIQHMTPVKAWREYLGLNQQDMADKLGITQSAYSKIEIKPNLKKNMLSRVAAALGIFEDQLDF